MKFPKEVLSFDLEKLKMKNDKNTLEIILNDPKNYNACGSAMGRQITKILTGYTPKSLSEMDSKPFIPLIEEEILKPNPNHKVIMISGEGGNFCAGTNLKESRNKCVDKEFDQIQENYRSRLTSAYLLSSIKPISIVFWEGYTMGLGAGFSFHSKIRICTDSTVYSIPECFYGMYPDFGFSYNLNHLFNGNRRIGLYFGLTGFRLKGINAMKCGIATHYAKKENIENVRNAIINLCDEKENVTIDDVKQAISQYTEEYNKDKFYFENEDLVNQVFIDDSIYNIFDRLKELQKSSDERIKKFSELTLKILNNTSPISLIVFFELFKRGQYLKSINHALALDLIYLPYIIEHGDMKESIRAKLVEKDNKLNFIYKSIYDIKDYEEIVKKYLHGIDELDFIKE